LDTVAIPLNKGEKLEFDLASLKRIALVYRDAISHAAELYQSGLKMKKPFDFEISIDETDTPTLSLAHVFVVKELQKLNIKFVSLAPRFIGEFQKGIDYIGDIEHFRNTFQIHAAIAKYFNTYKLSIHSGSDKFSIFPDIGKETQKCFHIKTSGTNWLQALSVISESSPLLFRELYQQSLRAFPVASQYYHVTPDFDNLTDIDTLKDGELNIVFENPNDRRILHIAYGEILKQTDLRDQIYAILLKNIEKYWLSLENHIEAHLTSLGVKRR
jgi:hypothetical protein